MSTKLQGNILDPARGELSSGTVVIEGDRVARVERHPVPEGAPWIAPGLVDAHVHVESSLLAPSAFARLALPRGTVAVVADPHEIANVLGVEGVRWMVEDGRRTPMIFWFGAPSCVPATAFETAGARLEAEELGRLFDEGSARFLSEVMDWPGVLAGAPAVMARIAAARARGLRVDGHGPGLHGEAAARYAAAGIDTDHECTTLEEAREKLALGVKVQIREGSAARDLDALQALVEEAPGRVMLCCDDLHPDDLARGHIDARVRRLLALGHDPLRVWQAASVAPIRHYGLPVGLLQPGDTADLLVLDDLEAVSVREVWLRGRRVAAGGLPLFDAGPVRPINRFVQRRIGVDELAVPDPGGPVRVIRARDGSLLTAAELATMQPRAGRLEPDPTRDLLLLAVLNRYEEAPPALAFVAGFGLARGALASSVSHDSHNVIAVGASRAELQRAVQAVLDVGGGLALAEGEHVELLPLPVAGLMSDADGLSVARHYASLNARAVALGSPLRAPFMTLSFMALLVIPELKLSDRGLFDGLGFRPVSLGA